jgi:hypothetical protein
MHVAQIVTISTGPWCLGCSGTHTCILFDFYLYGCTVCIHVSQDMYHTLTNTHAHTHAHMYTHVVDGTQYMYVLHVVHMTYDI